MLKGLLFVIPLVCLVTILLVVEADEPQNEDRVVGGSLALKEQSKFVVLFKWAKDNNNFCSGSLIKPTKVLTSAWCAKKMIGNNVNAVLNTLSTNPDRDAVIRRVTRAVYHQYYDERYMMYDIAVVTLDSAVNNFAGIAIDSTTSNLAGRTVTALGWGYNKSPGTQNLRSVSLISIVQLKNCADYYRNTYLNDGNYYICLQANGFTSCAVDAGGPIMSKNGYLIGINSGLDCNVGQPTAAVRLNDFYVNWINANI